VVVERGGVDVERGVVVLKVVLVEQATFRPPIWTTQGNITALDTFPENALPDRTPPGFPVRTPAGFERGALQGAL